MQIAAHYGYPLTVVHNAKRTLKQEIMERRRFPLPRKAQWCTAHHKRGPIQKHLRSLDAERIVSIQGHRRDESDFRARLSPWDVVPRLTVKRARKTRRPRTVYEWFPIIDWTLDDVLSYVAEHQIELHPIYQFLDRLSCEVCIFHSGKHFSATRKHNRRAFDEYSGMERDLQFTISLNQRYMDELADEYDAGGKQWTPPTALYTKGYDCGYW